MCNFRSTQGRVSRSSWGYRAGDVLTTINGMPLRRASNFALTISTMAPGSEVYFGTWRNEQLIEVTLLLVRADVRLCIRDRRRAATKCLFMRRGRKWPTHAEDNVIDPEPTFR
jgi:hypothetical protein